MAETSKQADAPARARLLELEDLLLKEPGGHPGFGGAPLSILAAMDLQDETDRNLKRLVDRVADHLFSPRQATLVRRHTDTYATLEQINRLLRAS